MTYANIFNDFCTRLQKSVNLFCRNMQKSVNPKPLYFIKNPCGEPQGWDKKLYILEDYKKGVKYIGMQIVAPSF